jgi:dipeptidyl aminopeptidase/acylaminoacyl peptidase
MDPGGSSPTNLTNNAASDKDPASSPDGTKIAFLSHRDAANSEIFVMNADGSNQTNLTNNGLDENGPDWQPQAVSDVDGVPDVSDNCPNAFNPEQADTDNDGIGDVCDFTPGPPILRGERGTAVLTEPFRLGRDKAVSGVETFVHLQPDAD